MAIDGVTSCMRIREVNKNKKQFISLLLLADEQESMVDCYLEKGTMYVLEECGFVRSHKIPNFFTDNYDHLIYEDGVQLIDMVYLQRHI